MKSRLLCALIAAVLCPLLSATTTVSGSIKTLGTTSANNSYVRFWLRGCNGNQPRVNGVAIMPSNTNGQFYFDFPSSSTGTITGLLYSTRDAAGTGAGEIDCGGSHTAAWYGMQVFRNSVGGPETPVHAKNTGTLDVSNVTPTSTNPVVVAPTGDSTYARLDGGNQPFTGNIQAPAATVTGAVTSGSVSTGAVAATSLNATIYATAGETVAHAVARLPVGGGKVIFDVGTYPSGGAIISTKNIWLQGAGMPNYNSATAPTALTGGTIIQGPVAAIQGADHLVIRDLGCDTGSTWTNANNGGTPVDCLSIANNGQVVGAPQVQAPIIENVNCLGFSTSAAVHCMLVENVNQAYVHNVQTVYDGHGFVLKGTNSKVDGVYARGHGIDSIIVKSDDYAPTAFDVLMNLRVTTLASAGDTKGIILQGVAAPLSDIQVSNVDVYQGASWGIYIQGASSSNFATNINISNVILNYPASPSSTYCMQFVQFVSLVHIDNLHCLNYWAGINPNLPNASFFNDFSLTNSHFINIANVGVETSGRWSISNSGFISIGTAIKNDLGVTSLGAGNQFASNTTNLNGIFQTVTGVPGEVLCSPALPTVSSGFNAGSIGTTPNGPCSFFVNVGAGTAGSTGVLTLPTATSGWSCFAQNQSRAGVVQQTTNSTTSATLTNFGTTFTATNWTNGDVILVSCFGR